MNHPRRCDGIKKTAHGETWFLPLLLSAPSINRKPYTVPQTLYPEILWPKALNPLPPDWEASNLELICTGGFRVLRSQLLMLSLSEVLAVV